MRRQTLPGAGLSVSALCLGTAAFGDTLDERLSFRLLDAFVEAGGNFVDTANVYGKWLEGGWSRSERIIGKWLRSRGCRDRVVIATKGAHPDLDAMHIPRLSPKCIADDLEESLRHLQTDYIDLYWLHRDDPARPAEEIVGALEEHVKAGRIRAYGCSNWSAARIAEARRCCDRHGFSGFVANQLRWNLATANRERLSYPGLVEMDEEAFLFHLHTNMPAVAYTSQANGFFSKALSGDDGNRPQFEKLRALYDNEPTRRALELVRLMSAETGLEPTQIALAYLLHQPFVTVPVIGPKNERQLRQSLDALELKLDERTLKRMREIRFPKLRGENRVPGL